MHIMISRYELSSRYLGIQEASSLQDARVNNLGNNLKVRGVGVLLEVGRVQWEVREDMAALGDLPLGLVGVNSGDQTVLELVDLQWDPTWEGQTWVQARV